MTAFVDTTTGEIVQACSADEARELTDRIKVAAEATWHLIKEAYEGRAWAALGYSSWDDYCTREFGSQRLRLPREERQEVVGSLREAGLSIRAIAAATGDSYGTVRRAVESGEPNGSPARPGEPCATNGHEPPKPSKVTGTDGKTYTRPARPPRPEVSPEEHERRSATAALVSSVEVLGRKDLTPEELRQAVDAMQRDRITRAIESAVEWLLTLHAEWDA